MSGTGRGPRARPRAAGIEPDRYTHSRRGQQQDAVALAATGTDGKPNAKLRSVKRSASPAFRGILPHGDAPGDVTESEPLDRKENPVNTGENPCLPGDWERKDSNLRRRKAGRFTVCSH
jgi:hypothetical protein